MSTNAGTGRSGAVRREADQFVLLTRHFFDRMFRNDVVDLGEQMKAVLGGVLAVLAIVLVWSSEMVLFKYHMVPDLNTSWQEKNYIFTLVMILFGIVTVIEWDVMSVDRQDFLNLTPLPVRLRTIFGAKLASFVLFVGLFSTAMNVLSAMVFTMYLADWRSNSIVFIGRYVLAHLIASFAACFTVFFACVFLQSFLMTVLPRTAGSRVSSLVRMVFLTGLIFVFLMFAGAPRALDESFGRLPELMASNDPFIYRFPPLWFVGLYEFLLGTTIAIYRKLAGMAGLALIASTALFGLAAAMSYFRHYRRSLETAKKRRTAPSLFRGTKDFMLRLFMPSPEGRAVSTFFSRTVRRNAKHRMTLAFFLAGGVGIVMMMLIGYRGKSALVSTYHPLLLVQPLVLAAALLLGMRSIVNVPAVFSANWIFRVTETPRTGRYVDAVKKTIWLAWLLPLFLAVLFAHVPLWGWRTAAMHAAFGLALSTVGLEAAFLKFHKVPFACTYVPGKTGAGAYGIFYFLVFVLFLDLAGLLERALLRGPSGFPWFFGFGAAAWLALRTVNVLAVRGSGLKFDDEMEPVMVTLGGGRD